MKFKEKTDLETMVEEACEWIEQQHKAMLRWVNSYLDKELMDLKWGLSDGVALMQLVNTVVGKMRDEKGEKLYCLAPIHKNPKMKLQKLENVDDVLHFMQYILQINVCNISACDVVEGNLKLNLGLVWSIYMFYVQRGLGKFARGLSLQRLKELLLKWVNSIIGRYGIEPIHNLNKDWSLEISRPDLIFQSILAHYQHQKIGCEPYGKKVQNLTRVFSKAREIGIPQLADVNDFKAFVPDEIIITTYLLEWYKFLLIDKKLLANTRGALGETLGALKNQYVNPVKRDDLETNKSIDKPHSEKNLKVDLIIECIVAFYKKKCQYEHESMNFKVDIESSQRLLECNLHYFTEPVLNSFCQSVSLCFQLLFSEELLNESGLNAFLDKFVIVKSRAELLLSCLQQIHQFRIKTKLRLAYDQLHLLTHTLSDMEDCLIFIGDKRTELRNKFSYSSFLEDFKRLTDVTEKNVLNSALTGMEILRNSLNGALDKSICIAVARNDASTASLTYQKRSKIHSCVESLDYILSFVHKLDYYCRCFCISKFPCELESALGHVNTHTKLPAHGSDCCYLYQSFVSKFQTKYILRSELIGVLRELTTPFFFEGKSDIVAAFVDIVATFDQKHVKIDDLLLQTLANTSPGVVSHDKHSVLSQCDYNSYDIHNFFLQLEKMNI